MKKIYCFNEDEIHEIKRLVGITNHESSVINQNIANTRCIKECIEIISNSAIKTLGLLDGR